MSRTPAIETGNASTVEQAPREHQPESVPPGSGRAHANFDAALPRLAPSQIGSVSVSLPLRMFEVTFAAIVLIATIPITAALALLIFRGFPGSSLFFQKRVGMNGKLIEFVKFRTLYVDAKERFPDLYAYEYSPEEVDTLNFKVANDPRITPQGRWMRKSTLDELPNFWNVLKGDMALVGPRPEIPEMVPYYSGDMLRKFSVRPGVTGLAQIRGRGRLGFLETIALDVEYVDTRSLWVDMKILALTAWKSITQEGAF